MLATYLLLRAAQEPGTRRFGAYGLSLVVLGYLHLFGLLIVPAHALALIPAARLAEARRGTTAGAGRPHRTAERPRTARRRGAGRQPRIPAPAQAGRPPAR